MTRKLSLPFILQSFIVFIALAGMMSCQLVADQLSKAATPAPVDAAEAADESTAVADQSDQPSEPTPIPPTAVPEPLPNLTFTPLDSMPIAANGETVTAVEGIEINLPPQTAADGAQTQLHQSDIPPAWRAALEQQYTIETPFVSLTMEGVNDGQGQATLRLLAPSPQSRAVAVIDQTYLATLNVEPQNGYLEIGASPRAVVDNQERVGSLTAGGSLHFVVLTPKEGVSAAPVKDKAGKPALQEGDSCGVLLDAYNLDINYCRQNAAGTVQVNYLSSSGLTEAQADQIANDMAAAMAEYERLGFTTAKLSNWFPMRIVVQKGLGDPQYRSGSGVIYLPLDATGSGANREILHEMAHWIQDEEYNMAWAFWSGGKTWWLETAAENMVMLQDPAYIPENLKVYGAISTDDNLLALQQSPYQWPSDFYAHAQLVKLNMCADPAVCPLSEASFAEAISAGTYPYESAAAQAQLSANLESYAQYLLGATPPRGNAAMPLTGPVASGNNYGEYINIAKTTNTDFRLGLGGYPPQMQKVNDEQGEAVAVRAVIQKDGVYPLLVSSGINGRNAGLPAALTIQPGAPFWYRLGGDAPQYHDGGKELILAPIHNVMGIPSVRLAAMGKNGGETLQAKLRQIDLQGAWLIVPAEAVSNNIVCLNNDGSSDNAIDAETWPLIVSLVGAMGDFRPDAVGSSLTWQWNEARLDSEMAEYAGSLLQFEGATLITSEDVDAQLGFTLERASAESRNPAGTSWLSLLMLIGGVAPAGIWMRRNRRLRPYTAVLTLALGLLLLTGCAGFGLDLWGTVNATMQFTELEYLGGEDVPTVGTEGLPETAVPIWKLRGTAEYDVDFYLETAVVDTEGNKETAVSHCTGSAKYNVEAQIFEDMILNLE